MCTKDEIKDFVLLHCPYCGNSQFDIEDTLYPDGVTWFLSEEGYKVYGRYMQHINMCWQVVCPCGAEVHADSREEAVRLWNTRFVVND